MKAIREKQHIMLEQLNNWNSHPKQVEERRQLNKYLPAQRKNCRLRIPYYKKISFRNEGEIKTFSGEWEIREFFRSRLALEELLKKGLQTKSPCVKEARLKRWCPVMVSFIWHSQNDKTLVIGDDQRLRGGRGGIRLWVKWDGIAWESFGGVRLSHPDCDGGCKNLYMQ